MLFRSGFVSCRYLLSVFCFTNQLGHGTHGAVDTPASRFIQDHGEKPQDGRGQHNTVKPESKLYGARVEPGAAVSPMPGEFERPQEGCHLFQIPGASKDQISIPKHLEKHKEKENQETVTEPLAFHPFGQIFFAGKAEPPAQQAEQLPPAAVPVTVG